MRSGCRIRENEHAPPLISRDMQIGRGMTAWRLSASVGCAEEVEPRSQRMNCLRCHGLMVTIRLEDPGSSTLCFSGWQCLLCSEVIDSVIDTNRKGLHVPTLSRGGRPRYGALLVPSGDRSCKRNENVTLSLAQATPESRSFTGDRRWQSGHSSASSWGPRDDPPNPEALSNKGGTSL
jgi:hypothetical protein